MTSCQTWTTSTHIRHPWFDTTIMKRKHPETVSPDDDLQVGGPVTAATKPPPPKRRRCSNLEQGFAHMTLGPTPIVGGTSPQRLSSIPPVPSAPEIQMDSVDADMPPLASTSTSPFPDSTHRPCYTIEEPSSAPEIKMKTSSWYEPEPDRIIITDMDSFTQEDEEDNGPLTVNPVFLDRIRSNNLEKSTSSRPSPSQALVLFKPLALGNKEDIDKMQKEEEDRRRKQAEAEVAAKRDTVDREGVIIDDDAMDVEP